MNKYLLKDSSPRSRKMLRGFFYAQNLFIIYEKSNRTTTKNENDDENHQ